jgi:hypothetical protein
MRERDQGDAMEVVPKVSITTLEGRRIVVQVMPYRSRTHLVVMDEDAPDWFLTKATMPATTSEWMNAVAEFCSKDKDYGWDTPRYRKLCIAGGLDPDHRRPRFAERDEAMGEAMAEVVGRTSTAPSPAAANALFDLLDLMRVDPWRRMLDAASVVSRIRGDMSRDEALRHELTRLMEEIGRMAGGRTPSFVVEPAQARLEG